MNTNSRRTSPAGRRFPVLLAAGVMLALAGSPVVQAAPDDNGIAAHEAAQDQPNQPAATFRYVRIPASAFEPRSDDSIKVDTTLGCIYNSGAGTDDRWEHKIVLPAGAEVRYVRLYYYDTNPGDDVRVWFTNYNGAGNFIDRTMVASVDGAGYGTSLGPLMSHIVDPVLESTTIVAGLGSASDGSVKFCGVRVAYYDPVVDTIFKNGFE